MVVFTQFIYDEKTLSVLHLFLGHCFVVCGWIKTLFGKNDFHNKMTCRMLNSGHYLQVHMATLKQISFPGHNFAVYGGI